MKPGVAKWWGKTKNRILKDKLEVSRQSLQEEPMPALDFIVYLYLLVKKDP